MNLLQQALVGEGSGEDQLFSSDSSSAKDIITTELDGYIQKLKVCHLNIILSFYSSNWHYIGG